ncbi:hypothetical protein ANN_17772 [Periplaneta americana]|uniref:Uncharacterized protein n=1 Tax=Periplaneta americana TaxID=6978 RepID=A0ABQ8SVE0_PERAM|nr:hypothetical protein ANN_17772 [Periplaneta americana]
MIQTAGILDFNHWWKTYFKKSVLSIESMGRGVKRDQKVTFHVNDFMEFQYEVDHISGRNFIGGLTVHTFKLFLSRSVLPMLPSVPAYPHGYYQTLRNWNHTFQQNIMIFIMNYILGQRHQLMTNHGDARKHTKEE